MRVWSLVLAFGLVVTLMACASGPDRNTSLSALAVAVGGSDVKVTNDNGNVDGGTPTPSFDAKNVQSNETSVAISPIDAAIVAVAANDYAMAPVFYDAWLGLYLSSDGGATWFNTMVPGFPSDASAAGLASPLHGLDLSNDPTVRFDGDGNLYLSGIALNYGFDPRERPVDTVVYVAKYLYTPGTPAGTSTVESAGNPPDFTYAFTTVVDRGAVGYAIPPQQPFGVAGVFDDKSWLAIDTHQGSACYGTLYASYTSFRGVAGAFPIVVAASSDGGATFGQPRPITQKRRDGGLAAQGANVAVAADGTLYLAYRTFPTRSDPETRLQLVRSDDCGKHFSAPLTAAVFQPMPAQAEGLNFRTPTLPWIAVDDADPSTVYVAFMAVAGGSDDADIFVTRSTDGGFTWPTPVRVNDDGTHKHQFWPTIDVSGGILHVAWYDFRNSPNANDPTLGNDALDVYYASSESASFPTFDPNTRITDVSHNPNCLMYFNDTVAFHGDYIELDAVSSGATEVVHIAWTDNRDVSPCDLSPTPDYPYGAWFTGLLNQNIYADTLTVSSP